LVGKVRKVENGQKRGKNGQKWAKRPEKSPF